MFYIKSFATFAQIYLAGITQAFIAVQVEPATDICPFPCFGKLDMLPSICKGFALETMLIN